MSPRVSRLFIPFALALIFLVALSSAAQAQGAKEATILTILPMDGPVQPNRSLTVQVRLTTQAGQPVPNQAIDLFLTQEIQRTSSTDENGVAGFNIRAPADAGTLTMAFSFKGDRAHQPSTISQPLVVTGSSGTHLAIEPLGTIPAGKNAVVTVRLSQGQGGAPIVGERVQLIVDGQNAESGITDPNGEVKLNSGRDLSVGQHQVLAVYGGSRLYGPANNSIQIGVRSLQIEVHTIPVLEGVRFKLEDRVFSTDKDGVARVTVDKAGTYNLEALPFESPGDVRAQFTGWDDRTSAPYHEVTVPNDAPINAGFTLSYRASQTFIDLDGHPVDPKRISSLTFKRNDGQVFTFENGETRWFETNYNVRRNNGLVSSPYLYSLMSVVVNGTNVVSAQQQRFYVHPNDKWTLQLLLFAANFSAHDQLFGFPLGESILLEYPDHFVQHVPLDDRATARVVSLPRGDYKVTVHSRLGFSPTSSLAMSRNQDVELPVVSWYDLGVGLILALLLGPGLLYVGQPRLRRALRDGSLLAGARLAMARRRPAFRRVDN